MKKFLICLFILAIFSSVVFWFGWTEVKVNPGEVGVVYTKTDGILNTPVVNGTFSWAWQFLLPTNAHIEKYNIEPVNTTKTITGKLPSASYYNGYNFDYSFSFSISLTVEPQSIIELIKLDRIRDQESLNAYMSNAGDAIAQLAANYVLQKLRDNQNYRVESIRREDILRSVNLYSEFPEIELTVFAITDSVVPDFRLYEKLNNQVLTGQKFITYENSNIKNEAIENSEDINE